MSETARDESTQSAPPCLSRSEYMSRTLRGDQERDSQALAHGSCACGRIKWTAFAHTLSSSNCYCSVCRKLSGSPYITFMSVPLNRLKFDPPLGEPYLKRFVASEAAERGFCGNCGSTMTMFYHAIQDRIWLAAGTLDSDAGSRFTFYAGPSRHIYCQDVPYWHGVAQDGLPQQQTMDTAEAYLGKATTMN